MTYLKNHIEATYFLQKKCWVYIWLHQAWIHANHTDSVVHVNRQWIDKPILLQIFNIFFRNGELKFYWLVLNEHVWALFKALCVCMTAGHTLTHTLQNNDNQIVENNFTVSLNRTMSCFTCKLFFFHRKFFEQLCHEFGRAWRSKYRTTHKQLTVVMKFDAKISESPRKVSKLASMMRREQVDIFV